jgi:hypothetical protein
MWNILEHRSISGTCKKLPIQVVKKYELWKDLVFRHGPDKLKEFPGFHDEKLKGDRAIAVEPAIPGDLRSRKRNRDGQRD